MDMDVEGESSSKGPATVAEIRSNVLAQLGEEKKKLQLMPQASKYVAHRLRVVNRATELMTLAMKEEKLEDQAEDELMSLLNNLKL